MAKISYSRQSLIDLERISDFLAQHGERAQLNALDLIDDAINTLRRHPLIGRKAEGGLHELVIPQGSTGYLALYTYDQHNDVILILAIRHQREAGFRRQV